MQKEGVQWSGLHHSFSLSAHHRLHHAAAGDDPMADLHLMTVLSGMLAVPCVIALTQGTDKTTKIFASAGVVVGAWLGLYRYVDFLDQMTTPTLVTVLGVLALLLAVIIAIRLKHQILGTLMITAGTLMALLALGVAR
jgi:hypothetical protein